MTELKTKPTDKNVEDFLNTIEHPEKRINSFELLEIMKEITKDKPILLGFIIIGFSTIHYKYKTGL
ncbi:MAG: hypothetical protein ACTSUV_06770 [Candidatus Ranarchaeia archaeon]